MLANFLSRLYHACWYITAAIIITAAVAVTVIRLMLPHINEYKPRLEDWISDKTGFVIAVENINAHWEGWTPTLLLDRIQVRDKTGKRVLTTLDSASVTVNPYISLQQRDLTQLQITIAGPDLLISRETDGSIEFANIDTSRQQPDNTGHSYFAEWVLQQRSIAIENASITYVDKNNPGMDLVLSNVNLQLRNSHSRIQIAATANLPEEFGNTLKISLDAFGDITSPDWNGRLYFEGNHIYPVRFLNPGKSTARLQPLENTPATIHAWSDWKNGQATKVRGEIAVADIQFPVSGKPHEISALAAAFSIDRTDPGLRARVDIRELQSDHGKWQPAVIDIFREQSSDKNRYRYIVDADYLKIDDVVPVLRYIEPSFLADNSKDYTGVLLQNQLIYEPESEQRLYFHSEIQALKIADPENNTTITASGGSVSGTPEWGQVQFQSSTLDLSLPQIFDRDINFYELNGDFNWTASDGGLLIESDHFETHTPHFDSTGKIKIAIIPGHESPLVDLRLNNTNINLEQLVYYMPVGVHKNVRDWMKSALVSGEITRLDILLRGYLYQFPYADLGGNFQAIARVKNAVLDYHPDWLPVRGINARFRMDNSHIEVTADAGSIHNALIDNAVATIPDVTSDTPGLVVKGSIRGNTNDARYIIDNSPLSESGTLAGIKQHDIDGQLRLDLTLDIPFYKKELDYDGRLHLEETRLQSSTLGITLDNINGIVNFNRDKIVTESLQGNYFGQPVTLDIKTDNNSRLLLGLEGNSDSQFIAGQLVHFFPNLAPAAEKLQDYLDGSTRWFASLAPTGNGETGSPGNSAMLSVHSDLSGLNISLPEPIGKGTEPAPLTISTIINNSREKNIRIEYNNNLLAGIAISQNGHSSLNRAEIAVGGGAQLFDTGNGLFIHGSLDRLSLSDWEKFIQAFKGKQESDEQRNIQVDLQVNSLEYLDQKFSNTDFRINNLQPDLYITLEGNGINGKIVLPGNLQQSPVKATFSTLHLQKNESEGEKINIDPRSKPPIDMTASDFSYGDIQLGEMTLLTSTAPDGLSIDNLGFSKPGIRINGSGHWQIINGEPRSDFEFKLKADKLDNMLTTFNYTVAPVKDGKTRLTVNANWNGSPMDFSLDGINGTLDMDIEKGQFLDIEPSAGRLFGLLSLQTLPRRLSLDFSDLFGKGFSFDKIEGTFSLESGNAYTNNLSMTGPSAYIQVSGRTGLAEKDYDQVVTVTPQISDSLPVASALFGPIGVGVGAVLFLAGELFESIPRQIDKLLRYQYSVKGSWDDPEVKRIQATASTGTTAEPFSQ